jgi:hypothetical protein
MSSPSRKILPSVASRSRVIRFTAVVFPLPLSPMMPRHSPGSRSKLMPFTAVKLLCPLRVKVFVRF